MVRYGFSGFFYLVGLTLFRSRDTAARWTWRRFVIMSGVLPALFALQVIHWIGFLLDNLFFSDWRKVEVHKPVFIVGIPRSGTTLLHRILARDASRFVTFTLWEMAFAPSIIERKCWMALGTVDKALGGLGRRFLTALDDRVFAGIRAIHPVSLFEPEEDEFVLLPVFASIFLYFLFPFPETLRYLTHFDEVTPRADVERIMGFYKACIQRHLYVHGPDKQFLSKNPSFSAKIDALDATFPDATVVCNVRTPYEAVPSLMSLLAYSWDQLDNDRQGNRLRDVLLEVAGHFYRHPIERLAGWPENRHAVIKFDALKEDPERTVRDLYARLGFEIGPAFAESLAHERRKAREFKSKHVYSMKEYDLEPEDIVENFRDVFSHFGFETRTDVHA